MLTVLHLQQGMQIWMLSFGLLMHRRVRGLSCTSRSHVSCCACNGCGIHELVLVLSTFWSVEANGRIAVVSAPAGPCFCIAWAAGCDIGSGDLVHLVTWLGGRFALEAACDRLLACMEKLFHLKTGFFFKKDVTLLHLACSSLSQRFSTFSVCDHLVEGLAGVRGQHVSLTRAPGAGYGMPCATLSTFCLSDMTAMLFRRTWRPS